VKVSLATAALAQADRDDTFDADEVTARLAELTEVLIPAS
jgi:hypothetical protein